MNAHPVFTAPSDVMIVLVPAVIVVLSIVFGMVAAVRHGYGKVVLIGGAVAMVGFFGVGFSLWSVAPQAAQAPIARPFEHQSNTSIRVLTPVVPINVVTSSGVASLTVLPVLLVLSLIVAGILAAIQRGHATAVLNVGLLIAGLGVVGALSKLEPQARANPTLWLVGAAVLISYLGMGFAWKHGAEQGWLRTGGLLLGTLMLVLMAIVVPAVLMVRKDAQRTLQQQDHGQALVFSNSLSPVPAVAVPALPVSGSPQPESDRPATPLAGPTPSKIEYIVGRGAALTVAELPQWRKNPPNEGDLDKGYSKYVMTSQQFATVDEAEAELFQTLTADVQRGFSYHWPETQGWVPTREDIVASGLITEKVIETIPLKVGEFENSVHRVSWLVEFRPDSNRALHARWFPLEAQRRSQWILGILAGITGAMGLAATVLRKRAGPIAEPVRV